MIPFHGVIGRRVRNSALDLQWALGFESFHPYPRRRLSEDSRGGSMQEICRSHAVFDSGFRIVDQKSSEVLEDKGQCTHAILSQLHGRVIQFSFKNFRQMCLHDCRLAAHQFIVLWGKIRPYSGGICAHEAGDSQQSWEVLRRIIGRHLARSDKGISGPLSCVNDRQCKGSIAATFPQKRREVIHNQNLTKIGYK